MNPPAFQRYVEITAPPAGDGWIVTPKLNGVAACYFQGKLFSRTMKVFPPHRFHHIVDELRFAGADCLYGELWNPALTLPEISGQCNHYSDSHEPTNLKFYVYDRFDHNNPYAGYEQRMIPARSLIEASRMNNVIPLTAFQTFDAPDDGIDGTVYRRRRAIFVPGKRAAGTLKLKKWKELDAVVIGTTQGEKEFAGLVGALVCTYNGKTFRVGSGLTVHDRHRYRTCRPKAVKIKYMNLSDEGIPLNPTFMEELNNNE